MYIISKVIPEFRDNDDGLAISLCSHVNVFRVKKTSVGGGAGNVEVSIRHMIHGIGNPFG